MPDPLFQTLFDETDTTTWAPTAVVRDMARRRVRRTKVLAAAAAVVAVGAISGGVAVAQRDQRIGPQPNASVSAAEPTPSNPAPSATQSPSSGPSTSSPATDTTRLTDELFLQPEDVGPGYRASSGSGGSGDWTFEFSTTAIGCEGPPDGYIEPSARREWTLNRGTPQAEDRLDQYVARYEPGEAARYLDRIRARVSACDPDTGKSIRIAAQRFAGQDSLLIEVNYGEGTTKHVLVRQGDLLTEFFTKPERNRQAAQDLGRKAAQRLCAGTPVC